MAFLFMPNGVRPDYWTPAGDGEDYEFTPHLKPLESLKSEFLLLENLWNKNTVGRNGHWPKVPAWLSGGYVERTTGSDLDSGGTTRRPGGRAAYWSRTRRLPRFELGIDPPRTGIDNAGRRIRPRVLGHFSPGAIRTRRCPKRSFRSWLSTACSATPTPVVSSVDPKHPSLLASLQRDETSVLDLVMDAGEIDCAAGQHRRTRCGSIEYFESVRSVEQRLEASMRPQKRWINQGKFPLERPAPGIPETHAEHVRLMLDILILAFWTRYHADRDDDVRATRRARRIIRSCPA